MSKDSNSYPPEKVGDEANIALIESNELPAQEPVRKNKFGKAFKLLLVVLAGYFTFNYFKSLGPHMQDVKSYFSNNWNPHNHPQHPPHQVCNPTTPYSLNATIEVDPEQYKSFGIAVLGHAKHSSVTFARHNSSKITVDHEIFVSSARAIDAIHLKTRTKDASYGVAITGPSFFHERGECYKINLVVNIPAELKSLETLWIRLPSGSISSDFKGLEVNKLHLKLIAGDLDVSGQASDVISLSTGVGNISLGDSNAKAVFLLTTKGHVKASEVKAKHIVGGTATGAIDLNLAEAGTVHAKSFNGNVDVSVAAVTPITPGSPKDGPPKDHFELMFPELKEDCPYKGHNHPKYPNRHNKGHNGKYGHISSDQLAALAMPLPIMLEPNSPIWKKTNNNRAKARRSFEHPPPPPPHRPEHPPHRPHHAGNNFNLGTANGNLHIALPASFHTKFAAKTFNGVAKVSVPEGSDSFHFKVQRNNAIIGYNFEENENLVEVSTFNGSPEIQFV